MKNVDLFGNKIIEKTSLKSEFVIPPFSILDTASGDWQNRKNMWKSLGIKSEIGRKVSSIVAGTDDYRKIKNKEGYDNKDNYTSIFDPLLCELMYKWFVPNNGSVLDPFAGGSVRGIVCNYLGYKYTGIELREEQVDANIQQGIDILPKNEPEWICNDSDKMLNFMDKKFDFIFSCPPYYDLEVYCDDPDDLSNMSYKDFNYKYESIIDKSSYLLKNNRFACFVVGNCRDKNGYMMDLVGNTIRAFEKAGLKFYNDIVLKNVVASGSMRAKGNMKYKKIVKIHQNVLIFVKGNPKEVFNNE
tara:strand:- start:298 stop:1200 length:903 start_codon:yes stop_codon:yes gene_type:complete